MKSTKNNHLTAMVARQGVSNKLLRNSSNLGRYPQALLSRKNSNSLQCRQVIISNQIDNVEWIANSQISGSGKDSEIEKTALLLHAMLVKERNRIEEVLENA
ncbi:hypothetical protein [Desulfopila sp. IMCC35008]|uniref:hypothetical protein n=1 Tax=Desulfopila sp. IMCC35008 TaxID=2653858 RepID=UPI0013D3FC96|nr:hypothetical protein [Desulfopila sp. IMCC35008]